MLSYRNITKTDAYLIFTWRNDPVTRQMSFNQDEKQWDDFKIEYATNYLQNPLKPILVLLNNQEISFVGFIPTQDQNVYKIAINVAPKFRGQGLGKKILKQAMHYAFTNDCTKLIAEIKTENTASIRLFESCQFKLVEKIDFVMVYEVHKFML